MVVDGDLAARELLAAYLEPEGYVTFYSSAGESESGAPGGPAWREYRARFSAGQLLSIVCVRDEEEAGRTRYGLASFRWFAAPSFLFGDPNEE